MARPCGSRWPHRPERRRRGCGEAVAAQAGRLGLPGTLTATTLHRLLGWRRDSSTRFVHDARNRLPYDVVVLDETSMVSLTMMAGCWRLCARNPPDPDR